MGHQGAALLDLVTSLRQALKARQAAAGDNALPWQMYERWISEIVADFWAVARLGIGATLGLMGVVSLPWVFVFRVGLDDPHPVPWIRLVLSCAMGQELYPDDQWHRLARAWQEFFPLDELEAEQQELFQRLLEAMPEFVRLLVNHRPRALGGLTLREAMETKGREPETLRRAYLRCRRDPNAMYALRPSLAFAMLGQARASGLLTPEKETQAVLTLLRSWALRRSWTGGGTKKECKCRSVGRRGGRTEFAQGESHV